METISELLASLLILSIAIILLTEFFYNIIRNKIQKLHSHPPSHLRPGADIGEDGKKRITHIGNGASHLLAFFSLSFSLLFQEGK